MTDSIPGSLPLLLQQYYARSPYTEVYVARSVSKELERNVLVISDQEICDEDAHCISKFLQDKTAIDEIECIEIKRSSGKQVGFRRGNQRACCGTRSNTNLSSLNANGSAFFYEIIKFVEKAKNLRKLSFESIEMSYDCIHSLGYSLSVSASQLHWLGFKCCQLGENSDIGLQIITPFIGQLSHLSVLSVELCDLTDACLPYIASTLKAHSHSFDSTFWNATLRTDAVMYDEEDQVARDTAYVYSRGLVALSLYGNGLTGLGIAQLTDVIKDNYWLLGINLANNKLDRGGIARLIDELQSNKVLQAVLLKNNPGLDPYATQVLYESMQQRGGGQGVELELDNHKLPGGKKRLEFLPNMVSQLLVKWMHLQAREAMDQTNPHALLIASAAPVQSDKVSNRNGTVLNTSHISTATMHSRSSLNIRESAALLRGSRDNRTLTEEYDPHYSLFPTVRTVPNLSGRSTPVTQSRRGSDNSDNVPKEAWMGQGQGAPGTRRRSLSSVSIDASMDTVSLGIKDYRNTVVQAVAGGGRYDMGGEASVRPRSAPTSKFGQEEVYDTDLPLYSESVDDQVRGADASDQDAHGRVVEKHMYQHERGSAEWDGEGVWGRDPGRLNEQWVAPSEIEADFQGVDGRPPSRMSVRPRVGRPTSEFMNVMSSQQYNVGSLEADPRPNETSWVSSRFLEGRANTRRAGSARAASAGKKGISSSADHAHAQQLISSRLSNSQQLTRSRLAKTVYPRNRSRHQTSPPKQSMNHAKRYSSPQVRYSVDGPKDGRGAVFGTEKRLMATGGEGMHSAASHYLQSTSATRWKDLHLYNLYKGDIKFRGDTVDIARGSRKTTYMNNRVVPTRKTLPLGLKVGSRSTSRERMRTSRNKKISHSKGVMKESASDAGRYGRMDGSMNDESEYSGNGNCKDDVEGMMGLEQQAVMFQQQMNTVMSSVLTVTQQLEHVSDKLSESMNVSLLLNKSINNQMQQNETSMLNTSFSASASTAPQHPSSPVQGQSSPSRHRKLSPSSPPMSALAFINGAGDHTDPVDPFHNDEAGAVDIVSNEMVTRMIKNQMEGKLRQLLQKPEF